MGCQKKGCMIGDQGRLHLAVVPSRKPCANCGAPGPNLKWRLSGRMGMLCRRCFSAFIEETNRSLGADDPVSGGYQAAEGDLYVQEVQPGWFNISRYQDAAWDDVTALSEIEADALIAGHAPLLPRSVTTEDRSHSAQLCARFTPSRSSNRNRDTVSTPYPPLMPVIHISLHRVASQVVDTWVGFWSLLWYHCNEPSIVVILSTSCWLTPPISSRPPAVFASPSLALEEAASALRCGRHTGSVHASRYIAAGCSWDP